MEPITIEEIIRRYVQLPNHASGTGWYEVLCKVCNDHGKKGPRAAFKFEEGTCAYHCFNCGIKTTYNPDTYTVLPKDFNKVLRAYNVPEDDIGKLRLYTLKKNDEHGTGSVTLKQNNVKINPQEIPLPDHFYRLSEASPDDRWAEVARYYLEDRSINPDDYPFYMSTGIPKSAVGSDLMKKAAINAAQKWKGRLIIPTYKDEKLIFYQGRDLTGKALKKYESPTTPKDRVMHGYDQLFTHSDAPLYVVEGFFDAFPLNGVAILGNELSEAQCVWLNKSNRDKVYIPDKQGDGARNARKALDLGWRIALPDVGNCKDISEAIVKYGRIYVHNTLRENTLEGFAAEAALSLYCKE